MNILTLTWIGFPFFIGFIIYLVPKLDKYIAMLGAIASAAFAFQLFVMPSAVTLELLDHFSVTLLVDRLSGYFILTNALVTAAVILYCWPTDKTAFFYAQILMVHGSLNAAFASTDFISLYPTFRRYSNRFNESQIVKIKAWNDYVAIIPGLFDVK